MEVGIALAALSMTQTASGIRSLHIATGVGCATPVLIVQHGICVQRQHLQWAPTLTLKRDR